MTVLSEVITREEVGEGGSAAGTTCYGGAAAAVLITVKVYVCV